MVAASQAHAEVAEATSRPRRRGRAQSPQVTARIIGVARQMLIARGVAGVTVDEVARQAKVGLGTLYRRWPSKEALLVDVITSTIAEDMVIPDTGDLSTDLTTLFRETVASWSEIGAIVAAALGEIHNPEWAALVRSVHRDRRAQTEVISQRAVARGELPPTTDAALLHDLLGGILWPRMVVLREPLTEWEIAAVIETVVRGARGGLLNTPMDAGPEE